MQDRKTEIDEFKRLDLRLIAVEQYGYEVDTKRSTRACTMLSNGRDKIAVSRRGSNYVFWSVGDDKRFQGSVIDFVAYEKNLYTASGKVDIGRVRQELRGHNGGLSYRHGSHEQASVLKAKLKESTLDLEGVANRFKRLHTIEGQHGFLCNVRGIPAELLASERLRGTLRTDLRYGNACFPHYTIAGDSKKRVLSGWEIKGPGISLYSSGGAKGLYMSRGGRGDEVLAIGEAGVDVLSYLALHGWEKTRVASLGGRMNGVQPKLVMAAIDRMEQGVIASICDRDQAGEETTRELEKLFRELRRNDLSFSDERPVEQGFDYNDVLKQKLGWGRDASQDLGIGM